jgi:hypothetical protein
VPRPKSAKSKTAAQVDAPEAEFERQRAPRNHNLDPDQLALEAAAKFQMDPGRWADFAWDWGFGELVGADGPRAWQGQINEDVRRHLANPATRYMPLQIAVASGHGIGKSAEMAQLAHWAMSCFKEARVVVTANTATQMKTKTVPEFMKWFRTSINGHWFDLQSTSFSVRDPRYRKSWTVDFVPWSEHNTEAFAGLHNKDKIILLLFDEGSKIADKVWEVAEGALTDERTIIIWVVFGNPTRNSGRFRECFRRFRERWVTYQIDSRTVPGATNLAKIEQWRVDHGEDSDFFKVRVRGQFPSQTARQFIGAEDADKGRAAMRGLKQEMFGFAPVILGVDPAWTGDDSLEIYLRQGLYSKHLRSIPFNDDDVLIANMVANLEDEYNADGVCVDLGYGTGIVSAGRALGRTWHLVNFGNLKTPDIGCLNMRSFIWREMRDWLKAGGAIDPMDQVLYDDLIGPETVPRLDGKIQLEAKEDMKERGLPSPNRADALALTFAVPFRKKPPRNAPGQRRGHAVDYDPYAAMR